VERGDAATVNPRHTGTAKKRIADVVVGCRFRRGVRHGRKQRHADDDSCKFRFHLYRPRSTSISPPSPPAKKAPPLALPLSGQVDNICALFQPHRLAPYAGSDKAPLIAPCQLRRVMHFWTNSPFGARYGLRRSLRISRTRADVAAAWLAGVGMSKMATTPRLPVSRSPALRPCAKELNSASSGLRECPLRIKTRPPSQRAQFRFRQVRNMARDSSPLVKLAYVCFSAGRARLAPTRRTYCAPQ
jgi:hypothetical protein